MASVLNSTIATTLRFLQNSFVNFNSSFPGFSNVDIYKNKKWIIKHRKQSTTVYVDDAYFDALLCEFTFLYDTPEDSGPQHGFIYRCTELHVTITCYPTTHAISVQGVQHRHWIDTILQDISQLLDHAPHKLMTPSPSPVPQDDTDNTSEEEVSFTPLTVSTRSKFASPQTVSTPTNKNGDIESNLRREIKRLKDSNRDLATQLQEYRELRSNFVQVTKAYQEQCERNDMLQAKLCSLTEPSSSDFEAQRSSSSSSTNKQSPQAPATAPISTPNPFSILNDEVPESVESVPSAPSLSLLTPDKQPPHRTDFSEPPMPAINITKSPTPPKSAPSTSSSNTNSNSTSDNASQPQPPQIVIFSNSICKRINSRRFYRGKSTKVIAKGGASIADVQKLVEDYPHNQAEYIILQAWTNDTTRNSASECTKRAEHLINATMLKFPTAKVIISGTLPRCIPVSLSNEPNRVSIDLNEKLQHKCSENERLTYLNQATSYTTESGNIRAEYFWDTVHLNNRGIGKYVMNIRNAINFMSHPTQSTHLPAT